MKQALEVRVNSLAQHMELCQSLRDVQDFGKLLNTPGDIAGNETITLALGELGSGLLSVGKWVGGKTIQGFSYAIQGAGKQLSKAFDDNQSYIKRVSGIVNKSESSDFKLSATLSSLLTAKGDPKTLSHDMETLVNYLDMLDKHSKDINEHLSRQLTVVRKLKDVKHTDDVFKVIEEFEKLEYPVFKLPVSVKDGYQSTGLPGGKVWSFILVDNVPKYSMSGDAPAGGGGDLSLSKSEVSSLLQKLEKVNTLHQRVKGNYDRYLESIKSWSDMVKVVDEKLSALEYRVTKTALTEAEKLLVGNQGALAFYSGFTPRVVGYTDRYIHGVLGVFA